MPEFRFFSFLLLLDLVSFVASTSSFVLSSSDSAVDACSCQRPSIGCGLLTSIFDLSCWSSFCMYAPDASQRLHAKLRENVFGQSASLDMIESYVVQHISAVNAGKSQTPLVLHFAGDNGMLLCCPLSSASSFFVCFRVFSSLLRVLSLLQFSYLLFSPLVASHSAHSALYVVVVVFKESARVIQLN